MEEEEEEEEEEEKKRGNSLGHVIKVTKSLLVFHLCKDKVLGVQRRG